MNKEQLIELITKLFAVHRWAIKDLIIEAWADYLLPRFENAEIELVCRAFLQASEDKKKLEAIDIYEMYENLRLGQIYKLENNQSFVVMECKQFFCSFCRLPRKHDFYYGIYICSVCGDNYIESRSIDIRRKCLDGELPAREKITEKNVFDLIDKFKIKSQCKICKAYNHDTVDCPYKNYKEKELEKVKEWSVK